MSITPNVVYNSVTNCVASQTDATGSVYAANEIHPQLSESLGDFGGCVETDRLLPESTLPREFRTRMHKMFDRIEHEFEREYQKLCAENYALQEKLEKFEEAEHLEPSNFAKKLTASQLSHRIKQQYKQSTSRFVSSLRPPPTNSVPSLTSTNLPGPSSSNQSTNLASSLSTSAADRNLSGAVSSSNSGCGGGSWKFVHRFTGHRDGVWEVSCFHNLMATASADTTVRLWSNSIQAKYPRFNYRQREIEEQLIISRTNDTCNRISCLMIYSGHSGSVNSVRFREANQLMLTASGDGTAHLIKLPQKFIENVTTPHNFLSNAHVDVDKLDPLLSNAAGYSIEHAQEDETTGVHDLEMSNEGQPSMGPMLLRDPSSVFQSATLIFLSSSGGVGGGGGLDSSPVAAADFLSGRDQLVTGSWDRLGRLYDLNTGQEVQSLAGHEYQLTDVRAAKNNLPVVVTSARDSTFRVWDFRSPCLEVHVQQAHSRTVSTTQFLPGSTDHLISAGTDRFCRLWDLRNSRSPLFTIRTDASINRLAISQIGHRVGVGMPQETKQTRCSMTAGEACGQSIEINSGHPLSSTATSLASPLNGFPCVFALPMDNRTVRFIDITGSRIGRIPRNIAQGHTRAITSAAWAEDGLCNLFTSSFDHQLLGWQLQVP